jgi:hypothetical protein
MEGNPKQATKKEKARRSEGRLGRRGAISRPLEMAREETQDPRVKCQCLCEVVLQRPTAFPRVKLQAASRRSSRTSKVASRAWSATAGPQIRQSGLSRSEERRRRRRRHGQSTVGRPVEEEASRGEARARKSSTVGPKGYAKWMRSRYKYEAAAGMQG